MKRASFTFSMFFNYIKIDLIKKFYFSINVFRSLVARLVVCLRGILLVFFSLILFINHTFFLVLCFLLGYTKMRF